MNIPPGYETTKQRAKRTGEAETTIRYWLRNGRLPYKTVRQTIRVIPMEAQPIVPGVKEK